VGLTGGARRGWRRLGNHPARTRARGAGRAVEARGGGGWATELGRAARQLGRGGGSRPAGWAAPESQPRGGEREGVFYFLLSI
jgi:hypothetical protein